MQRLGRNLRPSCADTRMDHILRSINSFQRRPRITIAEERILNSASAIVIRLTGLPPTFEEVQARMDTRSDETVYGEAVDRLLKSEHYGERMAQHWLDVVRYADSSGFANDFERGNAWRYRDYVVRSFNHDKAYDQFIIEQIAGDELVAEGDESLSQSEAMIALGFLRMGPWELTGMEVFRVARQRFLDDVTNSVGEVFLGHSLQCARCHDHKFDPIPTRDYYSVQAVFATTQQTERQAAFSPFENQEGFEEQRYLRQKEQQHAKVLRGSTRSFGQCFDLVSGPIRCAVKLLKMEARGFANS